MGVTTPERVRIASPVRCQSGCCWPSHIQPSQIRPADPQLVLGTFVDNPTDRIVQCGDISIEIIASIVNE
jgi:hypothetical protein